MHLRSALLCAFLAAIGGIPVATASAYTFTTVVDSNTERPDGQGNFRIWYPFTPSIDGNTVLISDYSPNLCGGADSLWNAPIVGGSYSRLVAVGDKAPGGTGDFEDLASPYGASAKNGIVVFESADGAGPGVYTIPLAGGKPKRVINYKQTFPDGAQFAVGAGTCEYTMEGVSTDGVHVAIAAGNRLLVAPVGSGKVTEAVNTAYGDNWPLSPKLQAGAQLIQPPDDCSIFGGISAPSGGPDISGNDLVFVGGTSGAGGNSTGLYRTGLDGFTTGSYSCGSPGEFVPPYLAYYGSAMPKDPNGAGNNGVGSISADSGDVAYVLSDWTNGYQCVNLQSTKATKFHSIACSNALLPGLTTLPLAFTSLALRDGTLAFVARDSASNNNYGLYVWDGQKLKKVIVSGNALDGGTVVSDWRWPALAVSPRGTSDGNIVFYARVEQANGDTPSGIFVAGPRK